jgi:hypothetical protein
LVVPRRVDSCGRSADAESWLETCCNTASMQWWGPRLRQWCSVGRGRGQIQELVWKENSVGTDLDMSARKDSKFLP